MPSDGVEFKSRRRRPRRTYTVTNSEDEGGETGWGAVNDEWTPPEKARCAAEGLLHAAVLR